MPKGQRYAPALVEAILDAYAGVDVTRHPSARRPNTPKQERLFLWEADGKVLIGNTSAFVRVLAERFGLARPPSTGFVHAILRQHGHALTQDPDHRWTGKTIGKYVEPAPWSEEA